MELIRYVRVVRRRLLLIVICPLVAGALAGVISYILPPTYEAQVVLVVRPAQPLPSTDPTAAALTSDQILRTYASLMIQRPLLQSVIADHKGKIAVESRAGEGATFIITLPRAES